VGTKNATYLTHLRSLLKSLRVTLKLDGVEGIFLLDTGATTTVVDADWWRLKGLPPLRPSQYTVTGADGKPLLVAGEALVQMKLAGYELISKVIVVEQLADPCGLLGLDVLLRMKAVIDLESLTLSTPAGAVSLAPAGGKGKTRKRMTIQARAQKVVEIRVPPFLQEEEYLLFEPLEHDAPENLAVGKGLVS